MAKNLKPKGPAPGRTTTDRTPLEDLQIPKIVDRYRDEFRRVTHDANVWREERARIGQGMVVVPTCGGTGYDRMLALLFDAHVEATIAEMAIVNDAGMPDRPLTLDDPKLQVLLRVALRAHLAAKAAIESEFEGDATGWRQWKNRFRERAADLAVRSRLPRDEALALFGVAKTTYYSALERAKKRSKG